MPPINNRDEASATVHQHLRDVLDVYTAEDEWDLDPALLVVVLEPIDGPEPEGTLTPVMTTVRRIEAAQPILSGAGLGDGLGLVAELLTQVPREVAHAFLAVSPGEYVVGAAALFEMWGLPKDVSDEEYLAFTDTGATIADHPRRQESRAVVALDSLGFLHVLTHRRGHDHPGADRHYDISKPPPPDAVMPLDRPEAEALRAVLVAAAEVTDTRTDEALS